MVLEKQSPCNIKSSCTSTNGGAEAVEEAAGCGVRQPLLKVTWHTNHIASPATLSNKGQKERTCVAELSCMTSRGRRELTVQKEEIQPYSETTGRKKDLDLNLTAHRG